MAKKSIVTQYTNVSAFSGRPADCTHHLIFGRNGALRDLADKDGLTIPLTAAEHQTAAKTQDRIHDNPIAERLSKIAGQLAWEKEFYKKLALHEEAYKHEIDPAREAFRARYGESWL